MRAVDARAGREEPWVADQRDEQLVHLEALDLPVQLGALCERRHGFGQLLVGAARVQLHLDMLVAHATHGEIVSPFA